MRIALCSYSQKEKETALLMKLGKVDRFDNGVFCIPRLFTDPALIYIFKSCSVSFLKSSIRYPLFKKLNCQNIQ